MPIIRINNYMESKSDSSDSDSSNSKLSYSDSSSNNDINFSDHYIPNNINFSENEIDIENSLVNRNIINESNYETCIICNDNFKDIVILRCGHIICLKCLISWFRTSKTCPFCREKINNINFNYLNIEDTNNYLDNDNQSQNDDCLTIRTFEKTICYFSLLYFTYLLLLSN